MPEGPDDADRTDIRWFWAYDAEGRRVTTAEPVGVRYCTNCRGAHAVAELIIAPRATLKAPTHRGKVVVCLEPLAQNIKPAGLAHSEFPPE